MKRALVIKMKDGNDVVLELSRATSVRTEKQMIHFDRLTNGSWRLIYNENLIPDFTNVEGFEIYRK